MKITDALYGEHGMFYPIFDYFESVMQSGPELSDFKAMTSVLGKMVVTHAGIEEEILFPALDKHLGEAGPLSVMRREHTEIDAYLDSALSADTSEEAVGHVRNMIGLMREHFAKEERVLFVITQKVLDEKEQEDIAEKWSELRGVGVMGTDAHTCFG
jgi:hemerythrin-like domain-containing protein